MYDLFVRLLLDFGVWFTLHMDSSTGLCNEGEANMICADSLRGGSDIQVLLGVFSVILSFCSFGRRRLIMARAGCISRFCDFDVIYHMSRFPSLFFIQTTQ
jgi:hypothetical protein